MVVHSYYCRVRRLRETGRQAEADGRAGPGQHAGGVHRVAVLCLSVCPDRGLQEGNGPH